MWLLFGSLAVLAAVLNVIWWFRRKNGSLWAGLSLSCTAFTLYAFYGDIAGRVNAGDWVGIEDIAPALSTALWVLTALSAALNLLLLASYTRRK